MGKKLNVVATFQVVWDADEVRELWNEPLMSDEELLIECEKSLEDDWDQYALNPEVIHLESFISE